jgi:hypothetical protein
MLSVATPVVSQVSDATALILAFLKFTLFDFLKDQFSFMKTGTEGMVRQMAAGAVGIQEALKQSTQANTGAIGEASKAELTDRNSRMFSVMGTMRIDGRSVSIGSTAPSACYQVNDATYLRSAREDMGRIVERVERDAAIWVTSPDRETRSRDEMVRDQRQYGTGIYDPSWVSNHTLTQAQAERAERSIKYTYSPPPINATAVAATPAGREVAQDLQRLQQQAALPQRVMARQLAMRSPINGERSYMGTMQEWGHTSVEDPVQTAALQAKTDTGVLRELAITAKRQLAVDVELMQSQSETNALLAMLVMRQIGDEMQDVVNTRLPRAAQTRQ